MKKNILALICALLSAFSVSLPLSAATLVERVTKGFDALEKKMGSGTPIQKANGLMKLEARSEVFELQVYGRLFQDDFKFFKKLKADFKELEDVIGQAKKWEDLLDQENLPTTKRTQYQGHLKDEMANLAGLLKKWDESKMISKYRQHVLELDLSEGQSIDLALESIKKEIKKVAEKDFDFTYGETGLHELRRSLRWPVMEFELFKDLFSVTKSTCPISENDLVTRGIKSRYLALRANPSAAKVVDYCAYAKIVGAVELLGKMKNDLEKEETLNDKLPLELKKKTESIYKEVLPSLKKL